MRATARRGISTTVTSQFVSTSRVKEQQNLRKEPLKMMISFFLFGELLPEKKEGFIILIECIHFSCYNQS
ncbi:hypothetical protein [Virgibacillus sp. DJP39]|uniref:hypothetical protein n=1 Tax=Virgibacillus sp. DJP39 TaxID=3409790 RepID=UPI003BB732EA